MSDSQGSSSGSNATGASAGVKVIDASSGYDLNDFGDSFDSYGKIDEGESEGDELEVEGSEEGSEDGTDDSDSDESEEDEADSEGEDEDESADEDEESEDAQPPSPKNKKYVAVGADGKKVELTGDFKFQKRIDGKLEEVTLEEALSTVAGERTVQARLGELGQLHSEVTRRGAEVEERMSQALTVANGIRELCKLAEGGQPQMLLLRAMELNGKTPGEAIKTLLTNVKKWAKSVEGMTEAQFQAMADKADADAARKELAARKKADEDGVAANTFQRQALAFIAKQTVTDEEFQQASRELRASGRGIPGSTPEERLVATVKHALATRHESLLDEALDEVNPELRDNREFREVVLQATDPRKHTLEDMVEILRDVLADRLAAASNNLSKKARASGKTATTTRQGHEKANKKRHFDRPADIYGD